MEWWKICDLFQKLTAREIVVYLGGFDFHRNRHFLLQVSASFLPGTSVCRNRGAWNLRYVKGKSYVGNIGMEVKLCNLIMSAFQMFHINSSWNYFAYGTIHTCTHTYGFTYPPPLRTYDFLSPHPLGKDSRWWFANQWGEGVLYRGFGKSNILGNCLRFLKKTFCKCANFLFPQFFSEKKIKFWFSDPPWWWWRCLGESQYRRGPTRPPPIDSQYYIKTLILKH